ncbi:hypothetical protein GOODEAATRI_031073 [Goodea atripinnis]|uniref:Uncharacterized protein n=1 Tax=Goodea atripinnis TaxID=208336 RepID=A0ABV0NF30_9TELE
MLTPSLFRGKWTQSSDTIGRFYQHLTGADCVMEHTKRTKQYKMRAKTECEALQLCDRPGWSAVLRWLCCFSILTSETIPSISPDIPSDPAKNKQIHNSDQVIGELASRARTDTCFCVTDAVGAVWVGDRKAANTLLIRRLMMDSAAKTLSPTADSSMIHHATTPISAATIFSGFPVFVLSGAV